MSFLKLTAAWWALWGSVATVMAGELVYAGVALTERSVASQLPGGSIAALFYAHIVISVPLSLFIVPIATELPEKVNSILWIRRGKDTLAFGNITGAMVFQGSLLPAIGLTITPWQATPEIVGGVVACYVSALWLFLASRRGHLHVWHLFVGGAIYSLYLTAVLVAH